MRHPQRSMNRTPVPIFELIVSLWKWSSGELMDCEAKEVHHIKENSAHKSAILLYPPTPQTLGDTLPWSLFIIGDCGVRLLCFRTMDGNIHGLKAR